MTLTEEHNARKQDYHWPTAPYLVEKLASLDPEMAEKRPVPFPFTSIDGNIDGSVSIILAVGIILLNSAEIIVLCRKGGKRKKPEHMILSLSCADCLVGIAYLICGLGKIIWKYNPNSHQISVVANEIRASFSFSIVASILHIFVIAVERFYAVKQPFKYRTIITSKRIIVILVIIWIFSATVTALFTQAKVLGKEIVSFGRITGWLIVITGMLMVFVYGYLAHFIFNRSKNCFQTEITKIKITQSHMKSKRETPYFALVLQLLLFFVLFWQQLVRFYPKKST